MGASRCEVKKKSTSGRNPNSFDSTYVCVGVCAWALAHASAEREVRQTENIYMPQHHRLASVMHASASADSEGCPKQSRTFSFCVCKVHRPYILPIWSLLCVGHGIQLQNGKISGRLATPWRGLKGSARPSTNVPSIINISINVP